MQTIYRHAPMYVQPYFIEGLQSPEQEVRELAAAQVERLASDKSALQAPVSYTHLTLPTIAKE